MAREAVDELARGCAPAHTLLDPRLSPNGAVLAWCRSGDDGAHLVVHPEVGPRQVVADRPAIRVAGGATGGGWCWTTASLGVVYVAVDGNLWHQRLDGSPAKRLTTHGPERTAWSPVCTPDGRAVLFVLDRAEVWRAPLGGGRGPGQATRIDDGTADFCADPWVARDGRVGWIAWDVPDMPWERSRAVTRHPDGRIERALPAGSVQQVHALPDGRSVCVRDDSGWAVVCVDDAPVVKEPFEHAEPMWSMGKRSIALSPDGTTVAFTRNERGFGRLCVADLATGHVREVARAVHEQLSWQGDRLAALRSGAVTPPQVVAYDTTTWERTVVAATEGHQWAAGQLVEPETLEVPSSDRSVGGVVHARLYRAADDQTEGGADGRADGRLMVLVHGGPSDQLAVSFLPRVAFWRALGWNVVVPDHRGSSGHGRAYRQVLDGRWGELDVADVVDVIECLVASGVADRRSIVVMGASSGGFTALGVLAAAPASVAAVVAVSPVTDLLDMAARTHRFERHYTERLIGPLPASEAEYRRRSPILHAERYTSRPLLLLHGADDPVVPVDRTTVFAERVRTAGGTVEVHVYPEEGHGMRTRANRIDEYLRVHAFVERHVQVGSGG